MFTKHVSRWLFFVIAVVLVTAVACGPAATPTPRATPTPAVQATPTPTPRPVATPTPTAAPTKEPSGQLKVALERIREPAFQPAKQVWPNESNRWAFGVHEAPAVYSQDLQQEPRLYKGWEIKPDGIIIRLREGIQFHKGLGEETAEDVVFSANQAMRPDSVFVNIDFTRGHWDQWQVVDKYTVKAPWKSPAPLFYFWFRNFTAAAPTVFSVYSKKYLDQYGDNPPLDIGEGPFEMMKFTPDDRVELDAVRNHWRKTADVAKLTVFEVREPATRIAQIKTGEVDITEVPLANLDSVVASTPGLKAREMKLAGSFCSLTPTGQYYEKVNPWKGNVAIDSIYYRKKADPKEFSEWIKAHPWIADIDDPASVERARKVRWAMALAINKDSLVRNVLAGHGATLFSHRFIRDSEPLWLEAGSHERWAKQMPPSGDVARAKQLLAEAGFPNGFDADLLITTGARPEVEAISPALFPMLEAVGIRAKVSKIDIAAGIARGRDNSWQELNVGCGSREPWPLHIQLNSVGGGGANVSIPAFNEYVKKSGEVGFSLDALRPITTQFADLMFQNQWAIALVQVERWFVTGPRVGSWTIIPGPGGHPNSYETVTLARQSGY